MNHNIYIPIKTDTPALSHKETEEYIYLAQNGCMESREKVVEGNIKLVLNIIKRFKHINESPQDLFQLGSIGLIKAIDNFDLSKGFKFSTYAVPMIIGEIKRYLRDNHTMKVSRMIQENARKVKDFREKYVHAYQIEPTFKEMAKSLKIAEEDLIMAIGLSNDVISLSKVMGENEDNKMQSLEEKIPDKNNWIDKWVDKESLKEMITSLNDKEKQIIKLRYFLDKTQNEIGTELGMSQAHVSRIEKSALSKLRKAI